MPKACLVALALASGALACQASVDGDAPPGGGGSGASGGSANLAGTAMLPPGTQQGALLPARIRRLTIAEYQATVAVSEVIGSAAADVSKDFVPDSRQGGFTVNEAQRVDPVFARQLWDAAAVLAADLRKHVAERAPCANLPSGADECATTFIRKFGDAAYRRPLADDEVAQLMTVFHAAFEGGSYEEGIELTVRAMLQSAGFLYLTEIGAAPGATIQLTPDEIASAISYLARGGPPSADLRQRAKDHDLDTPEGRAKLADPTGFYLYGGPGAQERVVRVMREWLGIDKVSQIAKDSNIYPEFAKVQNDLTLETNDYLGELATRYQGSLKELFASEWTVPSTGLSALYKGTPAGDGSRRVLVPGRVGILNQGAFLSVFAHAHETAPVLRGVAVMRRVACVPVGDPVDLMMAVVPPAPDPAKTTRERFSVHAQGSCAGCHKLIDSFGFAFEGFDGMGLSRTMDNGKPVDTNVVVAAGTDFDGTYADSNALSKALASSHQVRSCFARQMFRAMAGVSSAGTKPSEDDFVAHWNTTLPKEGDKVVDAYITDTLNAYFTSPSFAYRRAQ
jgi:hypothetical protein